MAELPPLAEGYELVVAVDLGTYGTGAALIFPELSLYDDPTRVLDSIVYIKPDDKGSALVTDKARTAVLYTGDDVETCGDEAPDVFMQIHQQYEAKREEDPHFTTEHPHAMYMEFKMKLREGERAADIDSTEVAATVFTGIPPDAAPPRRPLRTLFVDTIEHLVQHVERYVRDRYRDSHPGSSSVNFATMKKLFVFTVPAVWDDAAKAFMRRRAVDAGLVVKVNSTALTLGLEPDCAVLASVPTTVDTSIYARGKTVIIVDCGGGTVDMTVSEIVRETPIQLKEILPSCGGAWGARFVDIEMINWLQGLFGDYGSQIPPQQLYELRADWEVQKRTLRLSAPSEWTTLPGQTERVLKLSGSPTQFISIQIRGVIDALNAKLGVTDAREVFLQNIREYNEKNGLSKEEGFVLTASNKLRMSHRIAVAAFVPILTEITNTIEGLIEELRTRLERPLDVMVMAGGFAQSPVVQEHLRSMFSPHCPSIVVPLRPATAILSGAILSTMQRMPIVSRKMKFTYAFVGIETFNPALHDIEFAFSDSRGERRVHVLFPLVQKDDDVMPGHKVLREVVPSRREQSVIEFALYRLPYRISDPRADGSPRAIPTEIRKEGARNQLVSREFRAANLSIIVGGANLSYQDRRVNLTLSFNAIEIDARAESAISGDVSECKLDFE